MSDGDSREYQNSTILHEVEWRSPFRPTTDGIGSLVGRPSSSAEESQAVDHSTLYGVRSNQDRGYFKERGKTKSKEK
jgi:hypothetical protein